MSAQGTKKDIQISVGAKLSTVVIGGTKVDIASGGRKIIAYTNKGVEKKAVAPGKTAVKGAQISVSKNFNAVVLNGVTIEKAADGHLIISAPSSTLSIKPPPANDVSELELYAVVPVGHSHAGWIYMGRSRTTDAPFFIAPEDAGVLNYLKAKPLAAKQGARLCSDEELKQIFEVEDRGALKGTFNVAGIHHTHQWYGTTTAPTNYASSVSHCMIIRCVTDGNRAVGEKRWLYAWRFARD